MDEQLPELLDRTIDNYYMRRLSLNMAWDRLSLLRDKGETISPMDAIAYNQLVMALNIDVNLLRIYLRSGMLPDDVDGAGLNYYPLINADGEELLGQSYIPFDDIDGVVDRLDSVLTRPMVLSTKKTETSPIDAQSEKF